MDAAHVYEYLRGSNVQMRNYVLPGEIPDHLSYLVLNDLPPDGILASQQHYASLFTPEQLFHEQFYPYSQTIFVQCQGDQLAILGRFPDAISIDAGQVYNPYGRIRQGFIPTAPERLIFRY